MSKIIATVGALKTKNKTKKKLVAKKVHHKHAIITGWVINKMMIQKAGRNSKHKLILNNSIFGTILCERLLCFSDCNFGSKNG